MSDSKHITKEIIDHVVKQSPEIEDSVVASVRRVFESEHHHDLKKAELTELAQELIEIQTKTSDQEDGE